MIQIYHARNLLFSTCSILAADTTAILCLCYLIIWTGQLVIYNVQHYNNDITRAY